jgi:steroid 5-alpha reductase family enzyme
MVAGLAVVTGLMALVWLGSVVRRDASLVDRFWGVGFVILAWYYLSAGAGWSSALWPARLLVVLVTIWGIRLSLHITWRNWGHGEDYRYRAMRTVHGARFGWVSFFTVYLLQAVLLWVIATPLQVALRPAGPGEAGGQFWLGLGIVCWTTGFLFESLGDWQLSRFKADPANRGRVMDSGLWRYTRHPNYFGDALLWWGYFGFAAATGGWWTVFAPALMTLMLMRVSGVALLEKTLRETKPNYQDYVRRTSPFLPMPPRR